MNRTSCFYYVPALLLGCLATTAVAEEFTPDHIFVGCTDPDSETARVLEFTPDGTYVRTLDVSVTEGEYQETYGVAFGPDGLLYLGAHGTGTIHRVQANGVSEPWFSGDENLEDPDGLTFGPTGDLWVGSRGTDQLVRIDLDGNLADVPISEGYVGSPAAMTFTPSGRRILTSSSTPSVLVLDGLGNQSLRFADTIDDYPTHALEQPDGSFIVADYSASQLDLFTADGQATGSIDDEAFQGPFGMTRQSNGTLLIADYDASALHFLRLGEGVVNTIAHEDQTDGGYVAVAPYRFSAKLKAVVASEKSDDKRAKSKNVQVAIQPGTGTVMVRFHGPVTEGSVADRYGPAYVFRGHLTRRAGDSKNVVLHARLPDGVVGEGVGSVALQLKGQTAPDGRFVIKKFSGTLTVTLVDDTMIATFQGVKTLK